MARLLNVGVDGLTLRMKHEDGKVHFAYEQDVSAHLDFADKIRRERKVDTLLGGNEVNHVAFVPAGVIMKMLVEDGVNFYDDDQQREVLKLLETKYQRCKTTDKRIA